jgi:hypothetical protein
MTVKVAGITSWIHHSWIKKTATLAKPSDWLAGCDSSNPLRLRFQRSSQHHAIT